ncbi:lysophospholipid transporter LplT [Variovorax paradoxus]|uniref:Lysophospholipid transporter LplT n=1 Tax=Variovorax paradoxus TaxID=34073 RepID=A0A0H2M8C2_VARPD|nr:lysophospholipid transporter LplT [Variovorax paradoxus]KLN56922.1 lysophospholipid transporter LplT [Variovorax paradoxus]
MKRGFYTIMSAQFFSSLADNAIFVVAVELMRSTGAAEWQRAALVPIFAVFYVVLAPLVGAFADALPKGRVMFISNAIKVIGCLMMLFGSHPLLSYSIVGLGAAAYSPAKYGILTELLPASQLVKANGWIEGLTIASILLGIVLGGSLVGHAVSSRLLAFDMPLIDTGVDSPAEAAISVLIFIYVLAAWFNTRIPHTGVEMRPLRANPQHGLARNMFSLLPDFWHCNARLWRDKLGQISLATTTLFWGAGANLKYIVLAWAALALDYNTTQATALTGVVTIGMAVGAIVASMRMRLDMATRVIPMGIAMGLLVISMNLISNVWIAVPFLILLGGLGGFLVVPMNALLQHRGHNLMGAGRSIAVQNFNEQACILLLGGFYSACTGLGLSAFAAIGAFGGVVAGCMWLIRRWHHLNLRNYPEEVEHLLAIARSDKHH